MYSKIKKMNSGGFTLVEIIASIAILGLVIVAVLPFFPQIMSWTKSTEDQLVTSNLLSQVAYDLKNDSNLGTLEEGNLVLAEKYKYTINEIVYIPEVVLSQSDEEQALNLFRAHIEISSSNTYIYLVNQGEDNE